MATEMKPGGGNYFGGGIGRIKTVMDSAAAGDGRAIRFAAQVLVRNAKIRLSHPGTGRIYERGEHQVRFLAGHGARVQEVSYTVNKGIKAKSHQASAPGESPAVDEGTLRASVGSGIVAGVMRVGTGLAYGAALEHGTIGDGGFIAPRPWLRPALEDSRKEMGQVMVGELRSAVKNL